MIDRYGSLRHSHFSHRFWSTNLSRRLNPQFFFFLNSNGWEMYTRCLWSEQTSIVFLFLATTCIYIYIYTSIHDYVNCQSYKLYQDKDNYSAETWWGLRRGGVLKWGCISTHFSLLVWSWLLLSFFIIFLLVSDIWFIYFFYFSDLVNCQK